MTTIQAYLFISKTNLWICWICWFHKWQNIRK